MSLRAHLSAIVGDENTVARYLAEKIGHTALIAWCLVELVHLDALRAATIAAVGYVIIGKVLWLRRHRGEVPIIAEVEDWLFDTVIGLSVAVIALPNGWAITLGTAAVWCLLVAMGSNNNWGRPS